MTWRKPHFPPHHKLRYKGLLSSWEGERFSKKWCDLKGILFFSNRWAAEMMRSCKKRVYGLFGENLHLWIKKMTKFCTHKAGNKDVSWCCWRKTFKWSDHVIAPFKISLTMLKENNLPNLIVWPWPKRCKNPFDLPRSFERIIYTPQHTWISHWTCWRNTQCWFKSCRYALWAHDGIQAV